MSWDDYAADYQALIREREVESQFKAQALDGSACSVVKPRPITATAGWLPNFSAATRLWRRHYSSLIRHGMDKSSGFGESTRTIIDALQALILVVARIRPLSRKTPEVKSVRSKVHFQEVFSLVFGCRGD